MGLFSSSKTTVKQKSTNITDVTLTNQITNLIDLQALADAFNNIGTLFSDTLKDGSEKTQALMSALYQQIGLTQQASILTAAAQAQEQNQQNALLDRGLNMLKIAGLAVAGYFIWRKFL